MRGKKLKKVVEDELIPEEMIPVAPERDLDLERKDAEVMAEEELKDQSPAEIEIPPANGDKLWRHLSPKNVMAADINTVLRAHVLFEALKGYGVSQSLFDKLPKEVQTLFNYKLVDNEEWIPAENF